MKRVYKLQKGIRTHSISWLNNNVKDLEEIYKVYTVFQTSIFEVKKTSMMMIQTLNTLKRHIKIGIEEDTSNEFSRYLLKRKIEESSGSSEDHSAGKKKRIDYASSVVS